MKTIGGGIVKYVDVQLLPCPENATRLGQVVGSARLDLLWRGRVVESFALRPGDELMVADGDEVAPQTELVARDDFRRVLRAEIPEGIAAVVRWSGPRIGTLDEVSGMTGIGFAPGSRPIVLELLLDGASIATATMRGAIPIAPQGAVVRRGDPLASISKDQRIRGLDTGIETVRALVDARRLDSQPTALVAPCDAMVIDIGPRWIALRTTDDRMLRLRLPPRTYVVVAIGDAVVAGEAMTDGERNHHALLHAWGEHRLGEHIIAELTLLFGDKVPRAYCSLALRAMLQGGRLRGIRALARARRAR